MSEVDLSWKYWLFCLGLIISFLLLAGGVLNLTLIKGAYFKMRAWDNKIFEQTIPAARGTVYDCKGRVLAKSVYQYFKVDDKGNKLYEGVGDFDGFKFEGRDLAYELKRFYPYGESMSFLTGYLGKTEEGEVGEVLCQKRLTAEMLVGRMGVEKEMECVLTGKDGRRLIEVDARGEYVRELGRVEPEKGEDLHLSIDAFWQEKIYKMVSEYKKKIVVIISEPVTGKIIALVSTPSFDANNFSYQRDAEMVSAYLADGENRPLLNRAIASIYQPGSVFKIVMATAGLESGVIDGQSEFEDTGFIRVGEWIYTNWLWNKGGGTDGMVNVVAGIKRSNDIFFYRLGESLGVERIDNWAEKFGLGEKTGIELTGELAGVVPNPEWKERVKGEGWYLGNTYHLSIGQGDLLVTPLQINLVTNVIASGGKRCRMSLLEDGKENCVDLGIKKENLALVKEGMSEACKSGGTAWPLFNFKTSLACKTGTAEVGDGSEDTHAWLTAFGPSDYPEVSITVLVERGGEGSDVAAPMVGDILKEWFDEPETVVPRYEN